MSAAAEALIGIGVVMIKNQVIRNFMKEIKQKKTTFNFSEVNKKYCLFEKTDDRYSPVPIKYKNTITCGITTACNSEKAP